MKRVNIELQVGKVLRIDFKLEVGGTTQTVEVISEAAIVDTSQSTVAANVSASSFDHLPKGRGFDSLIALAPGARYESKSGGYQVDGASASENIFVIDGMDLTNLYSGCPADIGQDPVRVRAGAPDQVERLRSAVRRRDGRRDQRRHARAAATNFTATSAFTSRTDSMQRGRGPRCEVIPIDDDDGDVFRTTRWMATVF